MLTDFSELSENVLEIGVAIAKKQGAEIALLHVIDRLMNLNSSEFVSERQLSSDYMAEIKARLDSISSQIFIEKGIRTIGEVLDGFPLEKIHNYTLKKSISLIVMGGASNSEKVNTEVFKIIKNTTCPVLTIPENWSKAQFERVFIPIRPKSCVLEKYLYARPMIEKKNAKLLLLGLADKKSPNQVKEVTMLVDRLKKQLHNDNIEFQTQIGPSNDFSSVVLGTATRSKADLIVITANTEHGIVDRYTQQIVTHSRIPVLSIKPENSIDNSIMEYAENTVLSKPII